jgi:hypothetical protein
VIYSFAMLTADQLHRIQALEKELGTTIVAFSAQDVAMEQLTPEALRRLREEEECTGLTLLAVR